MTSAATFESELERTPTEARLDLFSGDMDPAALIGERLREPRPRAAGHRRSALDAVIRAYRGYAGTPYADRFSRGVVVFLTAPEPAVRAQALLFFETFPGAAGAEMLVRIARARRSLFAGVANPFAPSLDLEWQLLRAIGARILRRDREALAFGRAAALEPGRAWPLMAAMTAADPDWVAAFAESIVAASPGALGSLLSGLQRAGRDIAVVGRRIAGRAAVNPRLRATLERVPLDAALRRQLFAVVSDARRS